MALRRWFGGLVCFSSAGVGMGLLGACSVDDRDVSVGPVATPQRAIPNLPASTSAASGGSGPLGGASEQSSEGTGDAIAIAAGGAPSAGGTAPGASSQGGSTAGTAPSPPASPVILPDSLITVNLSGGQGHVTSKPAGIDCPGVCSATFTGGSTVDLIAERVANSASYFGGWSGDCIGFEDCPLLIDRDHSVNVSFGAANIAFVTSTTVDPTNLGGLEAADQICQTRAVAAGFDGTYVAWLSDFSSNALARVTGRGWVRPDGLEFADTAYGIVGGRVFYPLRVNELGADVGARLALTGTNGNGSWDQNSCGSFWNGTAGLYTTGSAAELGVSFNQYASYACNAALQQTSLFCFGTDRSVRVEPSRSNGRLAFVSRGGFTPGGGIAAADALCQSEAQAAGHTGTFLAELAVLGAIPEARFDLNGAPWVRADGVLLAATAAGYFHDALTQSAPNLTLKGEYHALDRNWYGQPSSGQATSDSTCANWSATGGNGGIIATVATTVQQGAAVQATACSNPEPVICLEN